MRYFAPSSLTSTLAVALFCATACAPDRPLSPREPSGSPAPAPPAPPSAATLSSYFPPPETAGGWRKTTDAAQIRDLGMDAGKLDALGAYLMSLPYEGYSTGVSGYKASNKAAIVVKNGWIVGEYYNQAGASTAVYYLASNGKTFAMLLAGHLAMTRADLNIGLSSRLYDPRWLPEGYPLTDARKADITLDQVFRHASGIIPEAQAAIARGSVETATEWNFAPFTVGKDADYPVSAPLYFTPGDPSTYTKGSPYSSVAFNHFALLFRNVTGLEASVYLRQGILDPIGVGRMDYKLTSGMGDYVWAPAGNGLASARDFARIGYLMLHEGEWNGAELLPASWLRQFTTVPAYPNIRSNADCRWGGKYPGDMYRTTGSGQNWALVVPSLDLVLTFNGRTPGSLASEIEQASLGALFASVTDRYVACDGTVFNDAPPAGNTPPVASFGSACAGLTCDFTDSSADHDGSLTSWSWSFGDGGTSTERHPGHTFAAGGTYSVALTVTDDGQASATASQGLTVYPIALSARGRKRKRYAYVDLSWSGSAAAMVDVYRDGAGLATVANDGAYTDATGRKGSPTFGYRVCEAGTSVCSNTVTVSF
jgi:CubicO group peptidase (beta-lactamase class C family)